MNPAIRDGKFLSLLGERLHPRPQRLVLHGGDLLGLIVRAGVAADEVLEGRLCGGEVPGEAVDEDPLHQIAGESEGFAFAEHFGRGHLEVDEARIGVDGVIRGFKGNEEDLAEDYVLDFLRRSLGFGSRHGNEDGVGAAAFLLTRWITEVLKELDFDQMSKS